MTLSHSIVCMYIHIHIHLSDQLQSRIGMKKLTKDEHLPLFETREAKFRILHRLYFASMLAGLSLILSYRWIQIPTANESKIMMCVCYGMLVVETWFACYWILTQILRWRPVYRNTFKDRLMQRYGKELPGVDIFVCTADPVIEPPLLVINTVLSLMAYDYPTEKLSVYLSDDGGSELTFYALLQAIEFAKHWLPFCKTFNVVPRSPAALFSAGTCQDGLDRFTAIKDMYDRMEERINTAVKQGRIPDDIRKTHKGFKEWDSVVSRKDHQTILEILIDGKGPNSVDEEGCPLPTVVYLAREKRPDHPHHYKAGAMNALIRVSSEISNAPIILNVDCDMYSNDPESVKDAVCFFMDEKAGNEIAYVQHPQSFVDLSPNDLYNSSLQVAYNVEFHGIDHYRGPLYIGTGCFHRRESLCGKKYTRDYKADWTIKSKQKEAVSVREMEERAKSQANCASEENTQWGKEMGLIYGCLVEDVATGLAIQCRGWRSMYHNPRRKGFMGVAPITLLSALAQVKRWGEGHLDIIFSRNSPLIQGFGKIRLAQQLSYCHYNFWALNSIPHLYYVVAPSLCLLNGLSLYPKVSSRWFLPFAFVLGAHYMYNLCEALCCRMTAKAWLNYQRMNLLRRTGAFPFSIIETMLRFLGIAKSNFIVTAKSAEDEGVATRYQQEIMDFGLPSPILTLLATLALLNLMSMLGALGRAGIRKETESFELLALQFLLCGSLIIINLPIYGAIFFRKDEGRLPASVTIKSIAQALFICCSVVSASFQD